MIATRNISRSNIRHSLAAFLFVGALLFLAVDRGTASALIMAVIASYVIGPEGLFVILALLVALLPEAGRSWSPSWIVHSFFALTALGLQSIDTDGDRCRLKPADKSIPIAVLILAACSFWGCARAAAAGVPLRLWFASHMAFMIPLCAFFIASRLATIRRIECFIYALLAASTINAAYGLWQVAGGFPVIDLVNNLFLTPIGQSHFESPTLELMWWGLPKAFGTFFGPSALAGLLVFVLAAGASVLAANRSGLWWVTLPLLYSGLMMTYSRAALIALTLSFILWAFYALRNNQRRVATIAILVACATPLAYCGLMNRTMLSDAAHRIHMEKRNPLAPDLAIQPTSQPRVNQVRPDDTFQAIKQQSVSIRINELKVFLAFVRAGYLGGIGYNTRFDIESGRPVPIGFFGRTVSNMYLEIFYRLGIVGFMACLVLVATIWWRLFHRLLVNNTCPPRMFFMFMTVTAISIIGLFDHTYLSTPSLALLWFMLLGFCHRQLSAGGFS